MGTGATIAITVGVLGVLGVGAYFLLSSGSAPAPAPQSTAPSSAAVGQSADQGIGLARDILGLITTGAQTFTSIYTTENARAEASRRDQYSTSIPMGMSGGGPIGPGFVR